MKLLASLALCIGSAWAFADTAPVYSGLGAFSSDYIVQLSEVASLIKAYTDQICSLDNNDKLYIYRVSGLANGKPASGDMSYVKHVHFDLAEDLDFAVSDKCLVKFGDAVGFDAGDANIVIVDIDDGNSHTHEEFLRHAGPVVVQGKPSFSVSKHTIKETIAGMYLDLDQLLKRGYESDEEVEESALFDEVEADFRAAQSMIAEEESTVTAFAGDDEGQYQAAKNSTNTKSNLFTEYQFFTPGVWLSLIVSLFLLYVITTAVGWVTSIETSYNAFEKQVDYEKKTE